MTATRKRSAAPLAWQSFALAIAFSIIQGCGNGGMDAGAIRPAMADSPNSPVRTITDYTIDLSVAKTNLRLGFGTKFIASDIASTGVATIYANDILGATYYLVPGWSGEIDAQDIYVSFPAQPGKILHLLFSNDQPIITTGAYVTIAGDVNLAAGSTVGITGAVNVTGSSVAISAPVSINGPVDVTGSTVNANIAGNVSITGTPNINIANTPAINIDPQPIVSIYNNYVSGAGAFGVVNIVAAGANPNGIKIYGGTVWAGAAGAGTTGSAWSRLYYVTPGGQPIGLAVAQATQGVASVQVEDSKSIEPFIVPAGCSLLWFTGYSGTSTGLYGSIGLNYKIL